jgi:hypothetical protein
VTAGRHGDWKISRGFLLERLLTDAEFRARYEIAKAQRAALTTEPAPQATPRKETHE